MPQRLKDDVRQRILAAAAEIIAEQGYSRAKLADIGERAGVTTSNIYKYFANKQALFDQIVTAPLAGQLLRLLRTRIREIPELEHWPDANARGSPAARQLLSFWVEHRLPVLILMRGAEGTRYAHVRATMIREMQRLSRDRVRRLGLELPPHADLVLRLVFTRTIDTIADILATYDKAPDIERAVGLFWRYQLGGLQSLFCEASVGGRPSMDSRPASD